MSRREDAARLLTAVAEAMNACEAAGLHLQIRHGVIQAAEGFVMPAGKRHWEARTLACAPFPAPPDGDDDD